MKRNWLVGLLGVMVLPVRCFIASTSYSLPSMSKLGGLYSRKYEDSEEKKYNKSNLPTKCCVVCNRPFTWRKKWAKVWDEVKYCSDKCRMNRNSQKELKMTLFDAMHPVWSQKFQIPGIGSLKVSKKSVNPLLQYFNSVILTLNLLASPGVAFALQDPLSIIKSLTTEDLRDPFENSDFQRLDESSDSIFYSSPRLVEHIDKEAVTQLTSYQTSFILQYFRGLSQPPAIKVLDLCSSWVSHINEDLLSKEIPTEKRAIIGLGMNEEELNRNKILTQRIVQDLNQKPSLTFLPDNSVDVILLQLSIDYLTSPIEVIKEAYRVLKPGGSFLIS